MKRLLMLVLVITACDKPSRGSTEQAVRRPAASQPVSATVESPAAGDPCAKAHAERGMAMPWIADDLPSALACAAKRSVPVVVDLWAPWCHTCLSMQSTVFTDPSFKSDADRFVFVALDTDRDVNAPALARFPPSEWPTFYVLGKDAATGQPDAVLARFSGAASPAQFHLFLDAGSKALAGGAAGADAHMLGGERAIALKDLATADQEITAALAMAPADWARRPDALTSLIFTKREAKDYAGCLTLAEKSLDDTGKTAAAADFLATAMTCAGSLQSDATTGERIKTLRERGVARLTALAGDASAPLSVDDRSTALATLRALDDALDHHADALAAARRERELLDDAAAKAPTPMMRMTYNAQRCNVYAFLGVPLELVPAIQKSAQELPAEYDPRIRLGGLYLKADRLTEATKWTDEALGMASGLPKAAALNQRARIAAQQHDKAGEKRYRQDLVTLLESLPPGQANPELLARAKQMLAATVDTR